MRLVLLSSALVAGFALAGEPSHRGPPQEALTACSGQSEGSACGFTLNGKNLTGQCRKGPRGEAAACLPEGFGRHHGPPPEAVEACSGKTEGTACTVAFDGKSLNGTCSKGHHGGDTVACRPEGGPPGGHRGPPPEASAACAGKTEGTACSFTHHERTLEGTCRTRPNGEALVCTPQRPN